MSCEVGKHEWSAVPCETSEDPACPYRFPCLHCDATTAQCEDHGPPESYTVDRYVYGDGSYPHPPCSYSGVDIASGPDETVWAIVDVATGKVMVAGRA